MGSVPNIEPDLPIELESGLLDIIAQSKRSDAMATAGRRWSLRCAFSLRTLFLAVTLATFLVWLAPAAWRVHQRKVVIEQIIAGGGNVRQIDGASDGERVAWGSFSTMGIKRNA